MRGLMMDRPLLVSSLLEHAACVFGSVEIVTRTVEGPVHRTTWTALRHRSRQLAQALQALHLRDGDAVATIAWNTYRHLELYYGVAGMGAVVHTVNPRLHPSQLVYVLNHARDRALFVDLTFVPLVEAVWDQLESVRHLVVMTDRAHMPDCRIPGALCYEDLLAAQDGAYDWPTFDETTAAGICYTSGTTGHPKGVVYSHRSSVLHAYAVALPCALPVGPGEALLPVVPMFHVNAWGIPYAAAMCGFKLVMPGPRLDGAGLTELMTAESVTTYCGVPTVHLGLLAHWRASGEGVPSLKTVTTGGAAPTSSMIAEFRSRGIGVVHGWGMTETSPVGTISRITAAEEALDDAAQVALLMRQGRKLFGVDLRVVDADGTMQITDRLKDLIKSGGEWISSIDLEDVAVRHPEIAAAAVIGVPHEKWGERPLLIAQPATGASPTRESVLEFLEGQVANLWLPDDVIFVDALPLGPTGKVQKTVLRERYRERGVGPS